MILPTPNDVREARFEINFTQARAAKLVHTTDSAWQSWEAHYSSDEYRQISGAAWELFLERPMNYARRIAFLNFAREFSPPQ